jgi:hypothetical protein
MMPSTNLPYVPASLKAYSGGYGSPFWEITLHKNRLIITRGKTGECPQSTVTVTPTATAWREFRQTLDDLRVWTWRAEYPNPGILDGGQWSLEVAYADRTLTTHGDNSYPGARGTPNITFNPTKTFNRYLAALKMLIGASVLE